MLTDYKKIIPLVLGAIIGITLFVFPEAKPLACGFPLALHHLGGL